MVQDRNDDDFDQPDIEEDKTINDEDIAIKLQLDGAKEDQKILDQEKSDKQFAVELQKKEAIEDRKVIEQERQGGPDAPQPPDQSDSKLAKKLQRDEIRKLDGNTELTDQELDDLMKQLLEEHMEKLKREQELKEQDIEGQEIDDQDIDDPEFESQGTEVVIVQQQHMVAPQQRTGPAPPKEQEMGQSPDKGKEKSSWDKVKETLYNSLNSDLKTLMLLIDAVGDQFEKVGDWMIENTVRLGQFLDQHSMEMSQYIMYLEDDLDLDIPEPELDNLDIEGMTDQGLDEIDVDELKEPTVDKKEKIAPPSPDKIGQSDMQAKKLDDQRGHMDKEFAKNFDLEKELEREGSDPDDLEMTQQEVNRILSEENEDITVEDPQQDITQQQSFRERH